MTSSSSPAAGFSQLYIHLLATHTYYKQTVFCIYYKSVCWSRRVELLLGNFYYLYARTVRLLCTRTRIHPRHPHCWQAVHAPTWCSYRIVSQYHVLPLLFLSRLQQFIGSQKHSNNHPRERDSVRQRRRDKGESPQSHLTVM